MSHTIRSKSQRLRFAADGFVDGDAGELRRVRTLRAHVQRAALDARRTLTPNEASPDAVVVALDPLSTHVHHGASAEDLRAVLRALPEGVTEGLSLVQSARIFDAPDDTDPDAFVPRDPLAGLRGYTQLLPGVHAAHTLWRHAPTTGAITLPAFVYEAPHPAAEIVALVLRHRTLASLVSAVSYHHELRLLPARGIRLGDDGARSALRWHARADAWIRDVVGP